jgi:hypothetical protein
MSFSVSVVTLGVADLDRSVAFYKDGLGMSRKPGFEDIAFFETTGSVFALYPREKLAEDIGISPEGNGFQGITLAHNVESPEAVDLMLERAVTAGAELIKPGQDVFWGGYSGYFSDPDGYFWEIAYNPYI